MTIEALGIVKDGDQITHRVLIWAALSLEMQFVRNAGYISFNDATESDLQQKRLEK